MLTKEYLLQKGFQEKSYPGQGTFLVYKTEDYDIMQNILGVDGDGTYEEVLILRCSINLSNKVLNTDGYIHELNETDFLEYVNRIPEVNS